MSNIIFYTSNCPRCKILETKLKQKNILFQVESSEESQKMLFDEGFREMPILEVDGVKYTFGDAVNWVNNYTE